MRTVALSFLLYSNLSPSDTFPPVLLYLGPDIFLPLTSALAAIIGIVLMFWRRFVAICHKLRHMFSRGRLQP